MNPRGISQIVLGVPKWQANQSRERRDIERERERERARLRLLAYRLSRKQNMKCRFHDIDIGVKYFNVVASQTITSNALLQ